MKHSLIQRTRGLALVEFVIALPVLLFLMLAIAEVGRALVQYTVLANSVRNAVRYVADAALPDQTGVVQLTSQVQTNGRNLVVYGSINTGTPILPGLAVNQVSVTNAGAGNVSVTAAYPYSSMLGGSIPTFGFGGGSISMTFNLQAAATMRALE